MSNQLRDQLQALFDREAPEVTMEEVASRLPSRSTRVRRPWLVAVAAMGAVLLLVGGMAVLFGGRAADPSHPGGAPSTVGEPSEDEAAVGGALSWRRIELAADGGQVASVVEFAGEFFVRTGTGSWFRSTDTVAWEEYTPGGDLDPGDDVLHLAPFPDGLVATGFADGVPAAWTSPDGASWTETILAADVHLENPADGAVAIGIAVHDGQILVGYHLTAGPTTLLFVNDGEIWGAVDSPHQDIVALSGVEKGFVATSASPLQSFFSETGEQWTKINTDVHPVLNWVVARPVQAFPGGYIMTSHCCWPDNQRPDTTLGQDGGVFVSTDGLEWEPAPIADIDFYPRSVAGGPLGAVAAVRHEYSQAPQDGTSAIYFSADGETWHRESLPADFFDDASAVRASQDHSNYLNIAVGSDAVVAGIASSPYRPGSGPTVLWVGTPRIIDTPSPTVDPITGIAPHPGDAPAPQPPPDSDFAPDDLHELVFSNPDAFVGLYHEAGSIVVVLGADAAEADWASP